MYANITESVQGKILLWENIYTCWCCQCTQHCSYRSTRLTHNYRTRNDQGLTLHAHTHCGTSVDTVHNRSSRQPFCADVSQPAVDTPLTGSLSWRSGQTGAAARHQLDRLLDEWSTRTTLKRADSTLLCSAATCKH